MEKAKAFLTEHGFESMKESYYTVYEDMVAMNFAYTPDQKRLALQLTTVDMSGIVRVAAVWGSADLYSAKADMGALLLAHQPLPAMPAAFSDDDKVRAFGFSGYNDDDAVKLAGL